MRVLRVGNLMDFALLPPVALLLAQVDAPEPGKEIYWIAGLMAVAIVGLFWEFVKSKNQQIAKGDQREDRLVADAAVFGPTIREQGSAVVSLVGAVEKGSEATISIGGRVDGLTLEVHNLSASVIEMKRSLDATLREMERERDRGSARA